MGQNIDMAIYCDTSSSGTIIDTPALNINIYSNMRHTEMTAHVNMEKMLTVSVIKRH